MFHSGSPKVTRSSYYWVNVRADAAIWSEVDFNVRLIKVTLSTWIAFRVLQMQQLVSQAELRDFKLRSIPIFCLIP